MSKLRFFLSQMPLNILKPAENATRIKLSTNAMVVLLIGGETNGFEPRNKGERGRNLSLIQAVFCDSRRPVRSVGGPDGGGKEGRQGSAPFGFLSPEDHYCVAEINRGTNGEPAVLCKVKNECNGTNKREREEKAEDREIPSQISSLLRPMHRREVHKGEQVLGRRMHAENESGLRRRRSACNQCTSRARLL